MQNAQIHTRKQRRKPVHIEIDNELPVAAVPHRGHSHAHCRIRLALEQARILNLDDWLFAFGRP